MLVKTINSREIWQSPDGKKTIWQVILQTHNKHAYSLKTYSKHIASLGFEGEVDSYVNKHGERFVRQSPKPHVESASTASNRDSSIRAQWAIGQAIALASATMDKQKITMKVIEKYAKQLFASVSRVKGEKLSDDMKKEAEDYIKGYTHAQGA